MHFVQSLGVMAKEVTAGQIRAARIIAVVADIIQWTPIGWGGGLFPLDDVLDLAVSGIMIYLLGFHCVFLPTLVIEVLPIADMAPTWTLAVLFATRNGPSIPAPVESGRVWDIDVRE